jgi:glycosyltransferase involved in cell wall biosynthesis
MSDVIREGENGWLLDSREPADWAARIEALLADRDGLRRAGEGARATGQRFRVEQVAAQALAWYSSIMR